MPMQWTIYGATTWHHFRFAKCSRAWDIFEKHTYLHSYIQTWPEPVFHRLLNSSFVPSAPSLRLNNCALTLKKEEDVGYSLGQTAGSNLNFDQSKFRLWHHQNGRSNALIRSGNQYLDCISDMYSFKPLITRLKVPITARFFPCL